MPGKGGPMTPEGRPMNVAFVITRADSMGGAQIHVLDLANALLSRGHDVTVLVGGEGPFTAELTRKQIPFQSLRSLVRPLRPAADLSAVLEIRSALRKLQPDLVAAHTAKAGILARWAAALAGVPAVFTPHGWSIGDRISPRQGSIFRLLERMSAHVCARIINVCEYERRLAKRYRIAPAAKLAAVHNGLPDIPADLLAQPDREPPRLIMVARFEQPKDHRTLLLGLSHLAQHDWKLDLVGDGPMQGEVMQIAANLGLAPRVRFLGARSDIAPLLANAQIFVLSSRSEAFPYSVLEAMRAGLPVVSSEVGGIAEAVNVGETGMLVPAKDSGALSRSLRRLITNPTLRVQMGEAGRRRFIDLFTIDKMVDRTLGVYREAVCQARGERKAGRLVQANQTIEMAEYKSK